MKKLVYLVFFISCVANATSYPEKSRLDSRDYALSICLRDNYSKVIPFKLEDLKDYSHYDTRRSPAQNFRLRDFVRKETKDYYSEDLPIHSELAPPPYNAIFQRCMEFYKSKKLDNFIKNNKPRGDD